MDHWGDVLFWLKGFPGPSPALLGLGKLGGGLSTPSLPLTMLWAGDTTDDEAVLWLGGGRLAGMQQKQAAMESTQLSWKQWVPPAPEASEPSSPSLPPAGSHLGQGRVLGMLPAAVGSLGQGD